MKVDFSGLSYVPTQVKKVWLNQIQEVIESGVFIGGHYVETFEREWSEYCGSSHAIGVSNGFDGLVLALRALDFGVGHKIAIPAHTFVATWNAVIAVGATPIGVDVDRDGLIDLEKFQGIASHVDAVIPVHMHGSAVDMKSLGDICEQVKDRNRVKIIEDASQAHGALTFDGQKLGAKSDLVVYSLYPTKNLGALGDAGVITTDDIALSERLKSLRNYGQEQLDKYAHSVLGFNNRLDPIQASILSVNLEMLPAWNRKRQYLSQIYISELGNSIEILQENREDSVRHHFCLLTSRRDQLRSYLHSKGIETEIHYPRVAGIEGLKFINEWASFPNAERISTQTLSLPVSQWHDEEKILFVIDEIKRWLVS